MSYQFYGWQTADMAPIDARYSLVRGDLRSPYADGLERG